MMNELLANRYALVQLIGEGGMASVYLAVDTILNREVAIKILRGELAKDPVALLRFQICKRSFIKRTCTKTWCFRKRRSG